MDRASLGDLDEPGPLLCRQVPDELQVSLDPVDPPFLGHALRAVGRVDPRVP